VQCCLVDKVGEVGATHARRPSGDEVEVDVVAHALLSAVDDKDWLALREVGEWHDDLTVEASRSQQRRIEDVRTVRRRHHDDALGRVEPIHLREHLVQGLLAFVVTTAEAGTSLSTDRVDLVDEDDRGRLLAGGLEEVADAAGADADEHLHEVRPRDREKRDARLTGDGAREQGLAGAWRPDEQDAFGDLRPDLLEPAG
jgi:hypothetical protein